MKRPAPRYGARRAPTLSLGLTALGLAFTSCQEPRRPQTPSVTAAVQQPVRSPSDVARKLLVLDVLNERVELERAVLSGARKAAALASGQEAVLRWLRQAELWDGLEPEELALLQSPLGSADNEQLLRAHWLVECGSVFLWALGARAALPAPSEPAADLRSSLPPPARLEEVGRFVSGARLRPAPELEAAVLRMAAERAALRSRWQVDATNELASLHNSRGLERLRALRWLFAPAKKGLWKTSPDPHYEHEHAHPAPRKK